VAITGDITGFDSNPSLGNGRGVMTLDSTVPIASDNWMMWPGIMHRLDLLQDFKPMNSVLWPGISIGMIILVVYVLQLIKEERKKREHRLKEDERLQNLCDSQLQKSMRERDVDEGRYVYVPNRGWYRICLC